MQTTCFVPEIVCVTQVTACWASGLPITKASTKTTTTTITITVIKNPITACICLLLNNNVVLHFILTTCQNIWCAFLLSLIDLSYLKLF